MGSIHNGASTYSAHFRIQLHPTDSLLRMLFGRLPGLGGIRKTRRHLVVVPAQAPMVALDVFNVLVYVWMHFHPLLDLQTLFTVQLLGPWRFCPTYTKKIGISKA